MQRSPTFRQTLITNALWFGAALVIAFFVWMTALTATDPIEEWRLSERVPIRVLIDDDVIIINGETLTTTASVQLRGQRSVRQLFAGDDILVSADFRGLGPGTHTVTLTAQTAPDRRVTVIGISPAQITAQLELRESILVPVEISITAPPPLVFAAGEPRFEVRQVTISGPASLVRQVTAARADLDLSAQRENFDGDLRLTPVDAEGAVVSGVTLAPDSVRAAVEVRPNAEVREVRVQPNPVGQLPDGYVLTSFDYAPRLVYIGGPADALQTLPGTLVTTPIDLSGRTSSFEQEVTIQLPSPELVAITGTTITVRVGIGTQTITRQYDRIPVEIVGAQEGFEYRLDPTEVSVLVTGPQPLLNQLAAEAVRVVVDVSAVTGPTDGDRSVQLTPTATIEGDDDEAAVAVLPALIDVRVIPPEAATPALPP